MRHMTKPCASPRAPIVARYASLYALFALACLALVAGCATRPPATDYPRQTSAALTAPEASATPLGAALAAPEAAHPGESGFRLLATGPDSLQMRIALARAATKTLDMQYYIANEDTTGKLLLGSALYAADRGVRVRMLVDDLNFHDIDQLMAALNSHPNIQIRVFNPYGSTSESMYLRTRNFFTNVDQFTRRMHNKATIVDNEMAIVGGRNLGDEYFNASPTIDFRDLDVLTAGPVAQSVSASFDEYWNCSISYPLSVLNHQKFDAHDLDTARDDLRKHWRESAEPYNAKPLNATPLAQQITGNTLGLVWAKWEFVADSPGKIAGSEKGELGDAMRSLLDRIHQAQSSVLVFSPYFVPHDTGVQTLRTLTSHGVRVAILTNSLAATDAVAVQAGYSPYRVPLLEAGVELYEFKPQQPEHTDQRRFGVVGSRSRASLHAKAYVIDDNTLVIGSLNLDPRSAHLNTELALTVESPPIAHQVADLFKRATSPQVSYHVTLATPAQLAQLQGTTINSPLVWTDEENGMMRTYNLDPGAGFYRNVLTGLFLLLPVDSQL
ncbi:phospholipase D family protein [Paraburkholderia acidiphila]|uniref:Phospholipase D family protein n=2 Tax=Paraburkholderia acidiphila TaxID=2571747 RepID=A0A7Z2G4S1_9BURK|nr:phospholipase D family protein [Paraburkholderia acidiphila]QGZ55213.1 phospholipase D family protein [Paraburkholderia acidiphila]